MDIRSLIHLWLNKPDSYDNGDEHQKCKMGVSQYGQVKFTEDKFSTQLTKYIGMVWGDSYSMIELWMDIDRAISRASADDHAMLTAYISVNLFRSEDDWEQWLEPSDQIVAIFDPVVKELCNH